MARTVSLFPICGHLIVSNFLAIMNKTAINIRVQGKRFLIILTEWSSALPTLHPSKHWLMIQKPLLFLFFPQMGTDSTINAFLQDAPELPILTYFPPQEIYA